MISQKKIYFHVPRNLFKRSLLVNNACHDKKSVADNKRSSSNAESQYLIIESANTDIHALTFGKIKRKRKFL